ncbi:MAG: hypothetical protein H0V09_01175, partial [Gemmatimonadetes bacterium]|nr:hypothetical protein [Gemmatimonadota bacterium]
MTRPAAGAPEADRMLRVEDSTVDRAGAAATRLAVEETLLRNGWRVVWFDETGGPLAGGARARLVDGVALRVLPGDEEILDIRLVRVEVGSLEVAEPTVQRLRRLAATARARWLVAAFDGERLRLLPDPDMEAASEAVPQDPEPLLAAVVRPRRPAGRSRSPSVPSHLAAGPE